MRAAQTCTLIHVIYYSEIRPVQSDELFVRNIQFQEFKPMLFHDLMVLFYLLKLYLTFWFFNVERRSYESKQGRIEVHHSILGQRHVHGYQALKTWKNESVLKD